MGRYYDGDISGELWFGVQSSDAADRFGVKGQVDKELSKSLVRNVHLYVILLKKNIYQKLLKRLGRLKNLWVMKKLC